MEDRRALAYREWAFLHLKDQKMNEVETSWLALREWKDLTHKARLTEPLIYVPTPDEYWRRRAEPHLITPFDLADHILIDATPNPSIRNGFPDDQFDGCFVGIYTILPLDYFRNEDEI